MCIYVCGVSVEVLLDRGDDNEGVMSDGICTLAAQGALYDEDGVSGSGLLVCIVGK